MSYAAWTRSTAGSLRLIARAALARSPSPGDVPGVLLEDLAE